jgi:hypothetical protein
MEINPYAPPQAELAVHVQEEGALYVVSTRKFWFLQILTTGLYQLYWSYENWRRLNEQEKLTIWPAPRAVFSIFFTHSLNSHVDIRLKRRKSTVAWSPGWWATVYVLFTLVPALFFMPIFERVSWQILELIWHVALFILSWAMWRTQRAINVASGDPKGESNNAFTAANYVWMVLGVALSAYFFYDSYRAATA